MPAESKKKKVCSTCQREYAAESELAFCPQDNSPLFLAATAELIGVTVGGHYKVESFAGYQGYVMLYVVQHQLAGDRFILKVLPLNFDTEEKVARFGLQCQSFSRVTHPGLVRLFDYGVLSDGRPYLVCEKHAGCTLAELIRQQPLLPVKAIEIFSQVCEVLAAVHNSGVVHGALRPSSIVVNNYDEAKLTIKITDLGMARLLAGEKLSLSDSVSLLSVLGLAAYASPELCMDKYVDAKSDIYALGCIMYEALTGRQPHSAKSDSDLIARHMSAVMPMPFTAACKEKRIPTILEGITFKAMSKDASERYQSAAEMSAALNHARASVEAPHVVAAFSGLLDRRREGLRREKVLWRVGRLALVGVLLILFVLVLQFILQRPAP